MKMSGHNITIKEEINMKRKKTMKSIFALILGAFIAISAVNPETAYAAGKKMSLNVGFKGKTVNLIKDINNGERNEITIASLKKKWGKPKVKKSDDGYFVFYTWKKGKTKIEVGDAVVEAGKKNYSGYVGSISISIKDKNGSLWGVKVGMSKADAMKKIKKALGTKKVLKQKSTKDGSIEIEGGWPDVDEVYISQGKDCINAWTGVYMPIGFGIKNGKVSSISFWRS